MERELLIGNLLYVMMNFMCLIEKLVLIHTYYIYVRYDGNTLIGHRLYKEVTVVESKTKVRGKGCSNLPNISLRWETLATNLEEFQKVRVSQKFCLVQY